MPEVRNVLFIQTDQQRRDLIGAYGNTVVRTPNIDRLAREGVVFEDAYAVSPICAPARASLLTGLYPIRHGVLQNVGNAETSGHDFRPGIETFGPALRRLGCRVSHIGKWHVGTDLTPEDCGFEGVYHPGYGYPDRHPHYLDHLRRVGAEGFRLRDRTYGRLPDGSRGPLLAAIQEGPERGAIPFYLAEQAVAAIDRAAAEHRRFFVRVDFWGPHVPYNIPQRYASMYDPADLPPWANFQDDLAGKPTVHRQMRRYWGVDDFTWDDWAKLVAGCYGYTTLIDDAIGQVISFLESRALLDTTAIFFASDHGGMVGAHGLCDKGPYLYQESCRVPLIARLPGGPGGRRLKGIAYNMDLMPTFLEVVGADVPGGLDAVSLTPALGEADDWRGRDAAYLEFHGHQCPYSARVLIQAGWKYVFNAPDSDELYDLATDPGELRNLVGEPRAAERLRALRLEMLERMRSFADPIDRFFVNTRLKG